MARSKTRKGTDIGTHSMVWKDTKGHQMTVNDTKQATKSHRTHTKQKIRAASAQGVSDHKGRSPLDNTSTFLIFSICFATFAIEVNSNSHFRAILSTPEAWTRIRTTFRARAIVSCLRSAHARGAVREPPGRGIVPYFPHLCLGGRLFLK